jgi:hypothetical protein
MIEWNTVFDAKCIVLNEGEDDEVTLYQPGIFDELNALLATINKEETGEHI